MVIDLSHDACVHKLVYFLQNGFCALWGLAELFMPYRRVSLSDFQLVFCNRSWHASHVLWFPCEDIQIPLQECAHSRSAFVRQRSSNRYVTTRIFGLLLFIFSIHFPEIFPKFDFCFMASSDKSFPLQIKCLTFIRSFSRKLLRNYTFRLKRNSKILHTTKLNRVNFPRIRKMFSTLMINQRIDRD